MIRIPLRMILIFWLKNSDPLIWTCSKYSLTIYAKIKKDIQSFTLIKMHRKNQKNIDEYYSRLSNGPMESFNRKHKETKESHEDSPTLIIHGIVYFGSHEKNNHILEAQNRTSWKMMTNVASGGCIILPRETPLSMIFLAYGSCIFK